MTKQMRLAPVPDNRPRNELETVQNTNKFLNGLLRRERFGTRACRPEITIASALLAKQVYELPSDIVRAVRAHNQQRAKFKRYESSAA